MSRLLSVNIHRDKIQDSRTLFNHGKNSSGYILQTIAQTKLQIQKKNIYIYIYIYIYICYIGKPAFHECRGDKSLCDISTAASFELP